MGLTTAYLVFITQNVSLNACNRQRLENNATTWWPVSWASSAHNNVVYLTAHHLQQATSRMERSEIKRPLIPRQGMMH
jgi:hypothetical protein